MLAELLREIAREVIVGAFEMAEIAGLRKRRMHATKDGFHAERTGVIAKCPSKYEAAGGAPVRAGS